MLRRILSVITGVIASVLVISIVEGICSRIYSLPKCNSIDETRTVLVNMPMAAYMIVLFGCALGCSVGGVIASLISGRTNASPAIIVGVLGLVAAIINSVMMKVQPMWFDVANALVCVPFAYIGFLSVRTEG